MFVRRKTRHLNVPTVTYDNLPICLGVSFGIINLFVGRLTIGSWLGAVPIALLSIAGGYAGARLAYRVFGKGKYSR